jgi:hypothetical protein
MRFDSTIRAAIDLLPGTAGDVDSNGPTSSVAILDRTERVMVP